MRKCTLAGAVLAATLALGLAPNGAKADHCHTGLLVFSGHHAGEQYGPALNGGLGGCLFLGWEDENIDNYLVPGATYATVGSYGTPADGNGGYCDPEAANGTECGVGTATLTGPDGAERTVTLTFTKATSRWNSQRVHLDGATVLTATVEARTGHTLSTTYRAVTEELS